MFACGINGPVELIEKGENKNCRAYRVSDGQYAHTSTPINSQPYVRLEYNPQVLWEHYVLVTWKIIRYRRAQLAYRLSST